MSDSAADVVSAAEPRHPQAGRERSGFSHRTVFAWLVASLVLALGVAWYVFENFVRYEPVAEQHLPQDMSVAVRVNVEQAVVYGSFRKTFMGLLEAHREGPEPRVKHLERKTTVELGVDLRELVFGHDDDGHWVIIAGGHFPRDGVVDGVKRMLDEEKIVVQRGESPPHLVHESGVAFTVARDGSLILASSLDLLRAAAPARVADHSFAPQAALSLWAPPHEHECCPVALKGVGLDVLPSGEKFPVELQAFFGRGAGEARTEASELEIVQGQTGDLQLLHELSDVQVLKREGDSLTARGQLTREQFDALLAGLAMEVAEMLGLPLDAVGEGSGRMAPG